MPPQMLGVASSTRPSRNSKGPAEETPMRSIEARSMPCSAQISSTSRMICTATASLLPVFAVGSLRRPINGDTLSAERLTATLVPPTSTQALMGPDPSCNQCRDHAQHDGARNRQLPLASEGAKLEIAGQPPEAEAPQPGREPAHQHERQDDDDQPANHGCSLGGQQRQ